MSKTKELLMQMYSRYDSLEGSMNELEEYYKNLEHEYYSGIRESVRSNK